ncbi:MAG TPA: alpha/beta hydrolase [Ilumatobacteraceae bacterium]|nr:alpha/beta hydrolase [Ilumatobacteraceae bacterium]
MSLDTVTMLRHGKVALALHHVRNATAAGGRPLLILHGLGEAAPRSAPRWADAWPGPVAALDFTGHGASTIPRGGGYTAELLLGDADAALNSLTEGDPTRSITVVGRGLGAYVALQIAGARAAQVRGAILVDGPGLAGGPTGPTSQSFFSLPIGASTPDPYALVELGRDLRPPDYAALFVRLALAGSELEEPIAVASVFRPEWLDAVAREHGVMQATLAEALATYAG